MSDAEIRSQLFALALEVDLEPWEAEFIDSIVAGELSLSSRQRSIAAGIIERHAACHYG